MTITAFILGWIFGILCGIALFYVTPGLRHKIRDDFLPWVREQWMKTGK